MVATLLVAPGGPAAAATYTAPRFDEMLSGPSRPLVAAWGIAYNPVTDEMVVGDYVTNQIRRFSRAGHYLGDFTNPAGNTESIISAVAVDPRDGSTYAAATSLTSKVQVRKYDAAGKYLWGFNVPGRVAWLAVDDEGHLWYPPAYGSHLVYQFEVDDSTRTVRQLSVGGVKGTGTCQASFLNGIDVAADEPGKPGTGRVYAADGVNAVVHVYDQTGKCLFDMGGRDVFTGDLRGIVVDDRLGRVYVADSKGTDVEVFDLDGTHLGTWDHTEGQGPGEFGAGSRQLAVTPEGNLHAADYSGFRVHEFAPDGAYLSTYPRPDREPDPAGLVEPWGLGIDPVDGDVLVADHWGQRIERFTSDGTHVTTFGRRGRTPDGFLNYPRDIAVDPATRDVWVLNAEGEPWLVVYTYDHETETFVVKRQIRTADLTTGLQIVGSEAFVVYRNRGIEVYDVATGALKRRHSHVGSGGYNGIGVDPASGRMWVTVNGGAQVRVLEPTGSLTWTLAADRSATDVAFRDGVAYVSDTGANRVIAYDSATGARLGSFGTDGSGPGQLRGPRGLEFGPDGRLYVVELRNQRIQAFTWEPARPAETTPPSVTIASPTGNAGPVLPVRLSGTATDDTGVGIVDVAVRHVSRNQWWNMLSGTWQSTIVFNQAVMGGPATATSWAWTGVSLDYGTSVEARVRVTDLSGNRRSVTRTFSVTDPTAPGVTITSPGSGTRAPGPLDVTVDAREDGVLDRVEVALVDPAAGTWWSPTTGFTSTESWVRARPVGGSYVGTVVLPAGGTYELRARATNGAGATASAPPVSVSSGADSEPADTAITSPAASDAVPSPLTVAGTASDNVAVDAVAVRLTDGTGRSWDAAAGTTTTTEVWNPATVDQRGARESTWSLTTSVPAGRWTARARATDSGGRTDASPAQVMFDVLAPGNAAPDTAISSPAGNTPAPPGTVVSGTATDDAGVQSVEVVVRDTTTLRYWDEATRTWGGKLVRNAVPVSPAGAGSVTWSYALPGADGSDHYVTLNARAVDTAGVTDPSVASRRFAGKVSGTGYVTREMWTGRSGTSLTSVPTGTAPSTVESVDVRAAGVTLSPNLDNYGTRVRMLVTAPVTGGYTFSLSSDDNGSLRMDTAGADPSKVTQIASVPGYTSSGQWDKYSSQRSATLNLVAGQAYYLEAVVKEGTGSDHLQVGWTTPGSSSTVFVPGSAVTPAGLLGAGGWR